MKVMVTGVAGFIGFHVAKQLLDRADQVVGVDNLNSYYDVKLKTDRLSQLQAREGFRFVHLDIANNEEVARHFKEARPARVVHLAAQAGVRHSMVDPSSYVNSNLVGFVNVMEGCRHNNVEHFVFASSSSVYGAGMSLPFSVGDNADSPINLYAASKRANELLAYSYSHLYHIPTTGLRFFTVYGPWGRPDMAPFLFTKAILEGRPIDVFNHGMMKRDFTYVDDIVTGVVRVADHAPQSVPVRHESSKQLVASEPYRLYNIGNSKPVGLLQFIEILEGLLGCKAIKNLLPMPPTDAVVTCANVDNLKRDVGFEPDTPIEVGLRRFVDWYRSYYNV